MFITNLFHASPRIPRITEHLPDFGWEVTIITPPINNEAIIELGLSTSFLDHSRIIDAPYKGDILWFYRRFFRSIGFARDRSITNQIKERVGVGSKKSIVEIMLYWYQALFGYPDTEKYWRDPARKAANYVLKNDEFDLILSSSPYPTSHFVAAEIKAKYSLFWVADFRDPWSQNENYPYPKLRKCIDEKLERKVISTADVVFAAAPEYARKQERFHKRQVITVTNGFSPNDYNDPPCPLTKKFTITYTGPIYANNQDPEKVLISIRNLLSRGLLDDRRIAVRFYGQPQGWLDDLIGYYKLNPIVRQYGIVPREESIQRQRESHILLHLNWEDPRRLGVYTVKFFEYISAQRPIIATGGHRGSGIENLINETKTGVYVITPHEIESVVLSYYDQYIRGEKLVYDANLNAVMQFSSKNIAKRLAEIFDSGISGNVSPR